MASKQLNEIIMNDHLRYNMMYLLQGMADQQLFPSDDFGFPIGYDKENDTMWCWTSSMLTITLNMTLPNEFTYSTWHPEDDDEKTFDSIEELEEWRKPKRDESSDESELSDVDCCQIIQD
jgi:hypothetical protein